ncbi:MAG: ECF-type sigma factor [Acidobacteriota bacterium]|nr:ECF-type sigma factor [Acidobacteriota bacterium]
MHNEPRVNFAVANLPPGITVLVKQWSSGDQEALDSLIDLLYDYLHKEAGKHMRSLHVQGNTLQPTMLINEAYLKFRKRGEAPALSRDHFFWFASRMIREIIVDHIRARTAQKRRRDDEMGVENMDLVAPAAHIDPDRFLALNQAVHALEKVNPRRSQVAVLRFIMGLGIKETAEVMETSPTTVKEDWNAAKAWLFKYLESKQTD